MAASLDDLATRRRNCLADELRKPARNEPVAIAKYEEGGTREGRPVLPDIVTMTVVE
jgi:hypothetical protein